MTFHVELWHIAVALALLILLATTFPKGSGLA